MNDFPRHREKLAGSVPIGFPKWDLTGVATGVEIGIDTLDRPLDDERTGANGTYVGDVKFGA